MDGVLKNACGRIKKTIDSIVGLGMYGSMDERELEEAENK